MSEYIERDAAIKATCFNCSERTICGGACDDTDRLRSIPAADVRPVVRGRDICDTVDGHCEFKCSVCGVEISYVYGGKNDFGLDGGYFNYCPNCGAWMGKS